MYSDINTTNIRKSFYKKKDLINVPNAQDEAVEISPIYDSHGEELIAHTSKNTMNDMILANAKQASDAGNTGNAASNAVLGKRSRSEAGGNEDVNAEAEP